ncbi:DASS family sodium-coupled anion symporter [Porticoccaceae bacterium LTM1]|nr:DASS family sodium-coupled anion symporter [Porticoccaceae bacterium LTM1]
MTTESQEHSSVSVKVEVEVHDNEPPMARKRILFILLGPVVALVLAVLPAPGSLTPEAWKLVALTAWMVIWWMTECTPIAVTALLPIAMMPLMGIEDQKAVSSNYGNPLVFLFLGGFLIAAAMQRWGLHKRIALSVVKIAGSSSGSIIGGFMVATAFLSMWISNTATALMMFTVGISLIDFVSHKVEDKSKVRRFGVALMLGIAYSASIGGVATLIGTPPNTLLASFLSDNYGIQIDFATWMMMGTPLMLIMLPVVWLLLCKWLFPVGNLDMGNAAALVERELQEMGQMSRGEKVVLTVFVCTAMLWMTRKWVVELTGLNFTDTSIALIAASLLFVIPASIQYNKFTIEWESARGIPWEILLLFGGGLALAAAFKSTGLAAEIGEMVGALDALDITLIILATTASIVFLTEITSNTATTATFLPILGAVSVGLGFDAMMLAIPVALAASMAFMMPVATPPNAIVFAYDGLRIHDMMKAGVWLNVISIGLIYLAMVYLAPMVFKLSFVPG